MCSFVDDLRKLHLTEPIATEATQVIDNSNNTLDTTLQPYGFAQNLDKQVHLPSLKNHAENRKVTVTCEHGKVADHARYLGRQQSARNSNVPERKNRLRATTVAWIAMGQFWFTPRLPRKARRLVFIAHIQGTILSGMEASVLYAIDYAAFDTKIIGYLRAMLRGDATQWTEAGHPHTSTNTQIFLRWKITPCALQLQTRRLRWYQDMVKYPFAHAQAIAALFGQCKFELEPTLLEDGTLDYDNAHPWAIQFINDILSLTRIECGYIFLTDIWPSRSIRQLFNDPDVSEAFTIIDIHELHAHYFHEALHNPHYQPPLPLQSLDSHEISDFQQTCELRISNGNICGRVFDSLQKLNVHQAKSLGGQHGVIHAGTRLCTSNQCAFCMVIYSDQRTCRNHMITAINNGACPENRTHSSHTLQAPKSNVCPICSIEHDRYEDLQRHIRQHVAQVPCIVEPVIPEAPYSLALSERLLAEHRRRRITKPQTP
jgi:hypothetical protein